MCPPLLSLCHEGEWYGVPIMLLSFPAGTNNGPTGHGIQSSKPRANTILPSTEADRLWYFDTVTHN